MTVIARYDFNETEGPYIHDSSDVAGDQLGWYMNTATAQDGRLVLDGESGFGKIFQDPIFQMNTGTLKFQFSSASQGNTPQTLVSRDSVGNTPGGFRMELMPEGSVRITHESGNDLFSETTPEGFVGTGDEVHVSYSWDHGGTGGRAIIQNLTTGEEFSATVPNTLGMDMGRLNQHWLIGAGQQKVEANTLAGIDQHFHGNFTYVEFSNSVDNMPVIPCFTAGTLIATPDGLRPVEDLRAGDRLITRDHGVQKLIWVGQRKLDAIDLATNPKLRPILIKRGALGPAVPAQDLLVSPNHRMLISRPSNELYFSENEVLVAAKFLVDGDNVQVSPIESVTYVHILFEQHELVLAAECWSESFQPGAYILGTIGQSQRDEILALFPDLAQNDRSFPAARPALSGTEAKLLARTDH